MGIKVTAPNSGSDYVEFQNAAGTSLAKVGGYDDGSSNGHLEIYTTASGTSAERMRIDSSGNVGIGATPLTSIAGYKSLDIGAVGNGFLSSTNDHYVTSNAYYNGGWKYATSYPVSYYQQTDGQHIWKAAGSGTSGAAITWIEQIGRAHV